VSEDTRTQPNLAEIMSRLEDKKLPPVHKWNPDFCGDIDMRIARDGTWFYMGSPIGRKRMVQLFSTVIRRDDDKYFLVTPVEKLGITVEDAPFVAVEASFLGDGDDRAIVFRTNVDDEVIADADHPIRVETDPETQEPSPYVLVRDNLWALIARSVFYHLVDAAEERQVNGRAVMGLPSRGEFFVIGRVDPARG
jgi:hypothetical protein